MRKFRLDYGTLGAPQRTPQGGLCVPAVLTRTGVFEYHTADGQTVREYRSPAEVFKADALDTIKNSTLTLDHPPQPVAPDNFRMVVQGHVGDDVRNDNGQVVASVYIQDQQAIRAIEAGRRDISLGYHCDVDETPGIVPAGETDAGKPYDRRQTNLQYNHTALVDHGRAGVARLRLDSADNSVGETNVADKTIEVIGKTPYDVGSEAHRAAVQRRDDNKAKIESSAAKLVEHCKGLQTALAAEKQRADAAEANAAKTVEQAKAIVSPERLDAMVAVRAKVIAKAAAVIGKEFKADSLSNREIKIAMVRKVYPDVRLDEKTTWEFVKGLYATINPVAAQTRNDSIPAHLVAPPPGAKAAPNARTASTIRRDSMMDDDDRAHRPLALSRRDKFKPADSRHKFMTSPPLASPAWWPSRAKRTSSSRKSRRDSSPSA